MQNTPSEKGKLSSCLKDRLKRCGRYHSSPLVARQPEKINKLQGSPELEQNELNETSNEQKSKRQCTESRNFETPVKSELTVNAINCLQQTSSDSSRNKKHILNCEDHILNSEITTQTSENNTPSHISESDKVFESVLINVPHSSLDSTPVTQRKTERFRFKGNKLSFENEDCENIGEDLCARNSDDTQRCIKTDVNINVSNNSTTACANAGHGDSDNVKPGDKDEHHKMTEMANTGDCVNSGKDDDYVTRSSMLKELTLKEEELRKLKMVKMYRSKNNLNELQVLIDKWRDVSQQALQDLHDAMSEPKPSLTQLINHLGIDHQLIRFSTENEEEDFY